MRMVKGLALILPFAAASGGVACNFCGADEQRAVNVGTGIDSLSVVVGGVPRKVEAVGRLIPQDIGEAEFGFVYNTIEGSRSGEGIALTLGGRDPITDDIV